MFYEWIKTWRIQRNFFSQNLLSWYIVDICYATSGLLFSGKNAERFA